MTKEKKNVVQTEGAIVKKNIAEAVLSRVNAMQESGGLVLPPDYNVGNALTAAYLDIQKTVDKNGKPAEQVCTPESATRALLDMVVQGLSPEKKQCYFVVHGNQLTLMRSYMGTVAAAKRFGGVKDVFAQVIYKGDDFEMEIDPTTGKRKVTRHGQSLEDIEEGTLRGAYASVVFEDGTIYQEIMTMDEIRKAWSQGAAKGDSPAHRKFAQEMAKKTVINRACKLFINTATDAPVLAESFNHTTENEHRAEEDGPVIDIPNEDIKTAAFNELFEDDQKKEEPPKFEALDEEAEEAFPAGEEAEA